jgi:hypothetical protein
MVILTAGSLGTPPGDGRVHVLQTQLPPVAIPTPLDQFGSHGGAHDKHAALRPWLGRRALRPKQHLFGLRGIDHHADHHLHAVATSAGDAQATPLCRKGLGHAWTGIAHMYLVAGATQTAGHAVAHGTQTHHAYLFHRLHVCVPENPKRSRMLAAEEMRATSGTANIWRTDLPRLQRVLATMAPQLGRQPSRRRGNSLRVHAMGESG